MKNQIIFLFSLILLCSFANPDKPNSGMIVVTFENLKKTEGFVQVSIYNKKKRFLKNNGALQTKRVQVSDKAIKVVFDNLPFGDYAITSYHDLNENKKVDKNFIGMPKEPVAVSTIKKKRYKKPRFNKVKMNFAQPEMLVELKFVEY